MFKQRGQPIDHGFGGLQISHGFSRFYRSIEQSYESQQKNQATTAPSPIYPAEFSARIGLHESGQPYVLPFVWTITIADHVRGLAYCYRQGPQMKFSQAWRSSADRDNLAHRLVIDGFEGVDSLSLGVISVLESDHFFLKGLIYSPSSHKGGL
jgi:hypothetical protein